MQDEYKIKVEEFFVENFNVDRIFSSVKRADYMLLHYVEKCCESSSHETGAYLSELAGAMELPMQDVSKAVQRMQDKGYVEWKTNPEVSKTYVELTTKAIQLMEEERALMKKCYDEIQKAVGQEELAQMADTMKKITQIVKECRNA